MPYRLELPDGSFVTVQDDAKPQAVALREAKEKFPDAFPAPPGVGEQLLSAPKEFLKGAASGVVQAVGGLGALPYAAARYVEPELKPFAETGFGKAITSAEQYLAPSDEGVITQLSGGLGSLASMLGPQVALRGIGGAGRLATGVAPRAAAPVAVAQTSGLGIEEARQRAEIARGEGVNVTPGEELAALSVGVPIGLTELLPVEKLFKGLHAGMDEGFKFGVANVLKRAFAQGGVEGAQEAASGLLQDLSAKGIYNPNLAVGESMLGEFGLGAGVGAIAQTGLDVLMRKDIQRAYNTKLQRDNQKRLQEETDRLRAEEQQQIDTTKKNLGIPDAQPLALPAPAAQVEPIVETDPLMNPVGYFNSDELTPEYLKAVNDIRDKEGKAKISQFSVEDLVDAGAPQAEVDRLLTFKTGYDGSTKLEAQDVINVAQQKNVDVTTPGFADFLRRSTGEADLTKMSQPQLFSAFKALDGIAPSETLQILPQGTNATRFTQEQYDKSVKSIKDLFPKTNLLGRSAVVQEIKDYSGLESDRDAESLLQTAINRGDLTTVSKPRFDVVDRSGKVVRSYLTRDSAERAAAKEGLSVREGTSINVAIPGEASSLPGGPDIRKGTFQEGTAPASFEVRGPDAVLTTAKTQEEADIKANRLAAMREQKANGFLGQVAKLESEMAKSQRKLEDMEADGKADTLEYKKLSAQIAANNKNLENQANRLRKKAQDYTQPLTVAPKGEKPVTREGYTLFQEGKPIATFPTQQAAEEASLANLSDDQIQGIIDTAPTLRGLMPQRLRKMAIDEQTRRRQATEVDATYGPKVSGIGVSFTGDKEAAADRLRAAGVKVAFTPEVQSQIDELSKKLRPIMDKLGLGDLRLNIVKAIKTPMGSADGSYVARLITIALDADNPVRTLRHEGIHALKELGAFTPEQWRVLENKAKSEWLQKYNIPQRYRGLSQEEQLEEAISDAFSDFDQTKAPAGLIGSLFRKIKQFMDALGNGFRGLGFQSSEGIFQRVEAGEMLPGAGVARGEKYSLQPRIMGTGKIVGAPPGLSTEGDRAKLVDDMIELLEHPFAMYNESKDWYERSGAAIREITRSNPELMERVVRLMSLYSQANQLGGNTTATIKSIAQLASGQDTAFAGRFPNETAKRIPAILAAKTMDDSLPGVDDKLMNFYRNLHDATFLTDTFADASTVDRWMMRLFGYPHAEDQEVGGATGVSKPQYIYAKDLIQRIADAESARTGETVLPRQVQAVLWTYVKNKTDYDSLPDDKKASFVPTTIDFNDYVVRATANINWESRPSTSLNLIPGIHTAPRKQQDAFNRAVRSIFVDPRTGEDKIFQLLGNQQLYSSEYSTGAYEGQVVPNIITKLVLQKDDGEYLTDVANNYAAIVGYVTKQDAVPWYRADPTASGKDASVGFRVTPNVEMTNELEEQLFNHLNKKLPGIGFTRVGGSLDFINFRGEDGKPFFMADKQYKEKLAEALRTFAPDVEFRAVPFRAKSGWISNDWKENPDGQGYIQRLRTAGLGDLQDTIDGWSKDYEQIAQDFGREYGWAKYSLRSDEPISGSSLGSGISIRDQQPTAKSFDAVHYGRESVNTLSGSMYGTGIKGAEAARIARSPDRRIKQRAYFYIPFSNGRMPLPEAGLGNYVHVQRLNNLLAPSPEMQALAQAATINGQFDENAFESAVIDAGYDGYAVPDMGMAVVLGADVPVVKRGTRQEVFERPADRSIAIGNQKYSLRQTDTPEFKKWFGKSTISTLRGYPKVMYHGTARDISEFRPKQANAIFVTDDPDFAENFSDTSEDYMVNFFIADNKVPRDNELLLKIEDQAIENALKDGAITPAGVKKIRKLPFFEWEKTEIGDYVRNAIKDNLPTRANIMPLFVRAEAPFDYQNAEDVQGVIDYIEEYKTPEKIYEAFNRDLDVVEDLRAEIEAGKWMTIENPVVQEAIRFNRHDGFYVKEGGVKNLAVYEPNQIKSAIGNIGTFARDNNDIRYSLALDGLQPQSRLIPNEGGNPDGNLGIAPTILESKPIRMLIGTHDDINDKGYGAKHILNRIMSDPRRTPVGTEEMLERVVKEAQRTAQSYTRIYKDRGRFILYNGRNSLVVSPEKDSMSIITMYKQTAPDTRYGNPVWQGRAPSVAEFLAPVRGMEVEAEGADIIPKPAAVARKRNVYTPGSISELAAEVRTTKPGKISLKKYPEKFSLAIPKESVRDFFAMADELPASESVDIIRSNWIGGVSGVGERNLAYELPYVQGGQEYTDLVQQTVRENLGESFKGYRLMSKDEFEELQGGSMGTQLASITLDPDFALAFARIPRYAKIPKGDLVVAEMDITPEHVQMIGGPTESELVIDYGVGYNPDEVVGYASPVSTAQPKFSIREQMGADMVDAIDRTTSRREEKGFIGRIIDALSPGSFAKFRQGFINKYEAIERQTGQIAKEFGSTELMADQSAIAAALFSDRAAGVAAASFGAMDRVGGIPVYKNGFTSISTENDTVKGLIPILEPLAKYNDPFIFQAFQFYAGTRRGKRLTAEGREKLFTPEDIKRGQLLEQQYPEFKQVFDEYQKYNEGLVNFMKDTGVISEKEAQIWMQNSDYIPFYRQMEGEKTVGPNVFSPIAGVAKPKKLKGGEAQLADFMETVVRNSRAAIEAGMKNVAAQRVIRDMLRLNQGELVPPTSSGADIVTVKENGLTKHYRVEDPMLVESLKGLNLPQLPFLEVLAAPSNILRNLVTKDPGFMLANLMRDSLQAWVTTGTNIKPIADTFKQYGRVLAGASPEAIALGRAGLFGGYDFAGDVNATASKVEEQLRKNVGAPRSTLETAALPITKMWELLDKGSHASDLATRAEVYKRTLEETGNEAEAAYQAMEVLNFSRKGNSALIRVVTALVPFMNARIQGLDVLYRAGWGKMASRTAERQQKAFITRSLTILALSSMYWMLASDTDEYKTAEQETRDNNWIIGNVRIPIPFEIGTVFKVFPERILEYFFGSDTGKDLQNSIVRNITSTLAFNPIPQAFLPVVENVANYSFFTGQPIVGRGMEDVAKPFQASTGTSMLAQEIGSATGQSPIMIDNLIRGYTGTLGTYAVMALDAVMRGEGDPTKATMRAEQLPIVKRFFASSQGTGTVSAYYELKKEVDKSVRTINFLERTGRMEDLREYMQDKGAKLYAIKPYIRQLDKDMTRLRELRSAVQNSKIDPDQKRDILDNIRKSEVGLTSRIQYLKKTLD